MKPDDKMNQTLSFKCFPDSQIFKDHIEFRQRLQKTLYYSRLPTTDCPSLPLTEFTVEWFTATIPDCGLKVLDMHYASSVSRKACISPCSMMLAMVYLEQLRKKNPEYLQTVSACDLFLVSMMVASKFLYDEGEMDEVFNSEWAISANMDLKELNKLEMEFLAAIDWDLYIKPNDFFKLMHSAELRIAQKKVSKRGWLTYTDMWVLSQGSVMVRCWSILMDGVIQTVVVSMVAYTAAALTLVGAVIMVNHCCIMNRGLRNRIENMPLNFKSSSTLLNNSSNIEILSNVNENTAEITDIIANNEFHLENSEWKHKFVQNTHNACNHNFPFTRIAEYQSTFSIHTLTAQNRPLKQPG